MYYHFILTFADDLLQRYIALGQAKLRMDSIQFHYVHKCISFYFFCSYMSDEYGRTSRPHLVRDRFLASSARQAQAIYQI